MGGQKSSKTPSLNGKTMKQRRSGGSWKNTGEAATPQRADGIGQRWRARLVRNRDCARRATLMSTGKPEEVVEKRTTAGEETKGVEAGTIRKRDQR